PLMEWSDKLITGVKEADEQHKKLVQLINELYDVMKQGKGKEILDKVLNELVNYAKYHFNTEETLMTKYGYPELKIHKAEHESFIKKVNEFMEKKAKGEVTLTMEVMTFLKEWLVKHIMGTDKKYGPFLTAKMGK
ncbi:MAG: bacteriohemerythrin, partial [Thermodesulfobacteriaceae bacterium]|nr:bacteriohemerythrin [Thermodesulfobacteriaceae bacterium]